MDIYGVGDIGKTTMCKTLCNEFNRKFNATMCKVELRQEHYVQLLQKTLNMLANSSLEFDKDLGED